jgi:glycosyltransferase involved in cell wall biosynthesis
MVDKEYVNVIFISSDWSFEHRKNLYNELFPKLGEWSDIVIVQQPVGIIGHFITRFRQKILGLFSGKYKTKKLGKGVVLFTPIIFFHYGLWLKKSFFSFIDIFLIKKQLNNYLLKNYKFQNIIYWVYNPHFTYLVEKLKYYFLVYDYMDNLDYDSSGNYLSNNASLNNCLINKSDLIVCTSSYLFEKIHYLNSSSIYVNNGNNYKILTTGKKDFSITELSDIRNPIIGYVGGIRDWIDFELLNYLIKRLPGTYFVFIGILYRNAKSSFNDILKNKNVVWIRYKEQNLLSNYMRKFSIGIIPFKINEFMKGVFPNKFFEYMACKTPIVTTALPELKQYSEIIGYSNNNEEFLNNCELAIKGGFENKIKYYSSIAAENSWEKKAGIIDKVLRDKIYLLEQTQ